MRVGAEIGHRHGRHRHHAGRQSQKLQQPECAALDEPDGREHCHPGKFQVGASRARGSLASPRRLELRDTIISAARQPPGGKMASAASMVTAGAADGVRPKARPAGRPYRGLPPAPWRAWAPLGDAAAAMAAAGSSPPSATSGVRWTTSPSATSRMVRLSRISQRPSTRAAATMWPWSTALSCTSTRRRSDAGTPASLSATYLAMA